MALVSVLVPIYNVDEYVRQCVESILAQTQGELEVMLIDDGSTDASGSIADEYALHDERVRVIHKPNSGYGDSMNRGLSESHGEWIAIVEPDDWVEPTMIELLLDAVEAQRSSNRPIDIVKADYLRVIGGSSGEEHDEPSAYATLMRSPLRPFSIDECPTPLRLHPSIWTALYRKAFLDEFGIRFLPIPGAGWADNPFFLETMIAARSIVYVDEPVYHYREFEDGTLSHLKNWRIICDRWAEMQDVLAKYDVHMPTILEAHACRGCAYLQMLHDDFEQTDELVRAARAMAQTLDLGVVSGSENIPKEYKAALGAYLTARERAVLFLGWIGMQMRSRMTK